MRRAPAIDAGPIIAELADPGDSDRLTDRILDATIDLLSAGGVRRCSLEEIAERAGLGRTSVYRRFDGRDQIISATLARECRRLFTAINQAVGHLDRLEDKVVEGFLVGLDMVQGSVLRQLMRSDPATFLPLITTEAGPLLHTATRFLVDQSRLAGGGADADSTAAVAELLVRLAFSFVLTPESVLPLGGRDQDDQPDQATARAALHRCLDPLLTPGTARRSRSR